MTQDGAAMERVREALEEHGCQPHGSNVRLRARCPAHQGEHSRTLTLSASQGRTGALITCFAGCELVDIRDALGLTWDDLFDAPRDRPASWVPRPRRPDDPMAALKRVFARAAGLISLRGQLARVPMGPPLGWQERVELAERGGQQDQDAHYWRTLARWAALATDETYVRQAYRDRAEGRATNEQVMALITRAGTPRPRPAGQHAGPHSRPGRLPREGAGAGPGGGREASAARGTRLDRRGGAHLGTGTRHGCIRQNQWHQPGGGEACLSRRSVT